MTNSLLSDWDTPFGLPPFNQISDEDFSPAFDTAIENARAQIKAIAENPEPPSMANTIDALEIADEELSRVLSAFFTLVSTSANPKLEALQRDFSPRLACPPVGCSVQDDVADRGGPQLAQVGRDARLVAPKLLQP